MKCNYEGLGCWWNLIRTTEHLTSLHTALWQSYLRRRPLTLGTCWRHISTMKMAPRRIPKPISIKGTLTTTLPRVTTACTFLADSSSMTTLCRGSWRKSCWGSTEELGRHFFAVEYLHTPLNVLVLFQVKPFSIQAWVLRLLPHWGTAQETPPFWRFRFGYNEKKYQHYDGTQKLGKGLSQQTCFTCNTIVLTNHRTHLMKNNVKKRITLSKQGHFYICLQGNVFINLYPTYPCWVVDVLSMIHAVSWPCHHSPPTKWLIEK